MIKTAKTIFFLFAFSMIVISGCCCTTETDGGGNAAADKKIESVVFNKLDGKPLDTIKAAEGKPLYLSFFASWCKECPKEVPHNNEIFKEYVEKGMVAMYGVAVGDPKKVAKKMIDKYDIKYTVLLDNESVAQDIFGILGLPFNIVLSAKGEIVYSGSKPPPDDILAKVIIEE